MVCLAKNQRDSLYRERFVAYLLGWGLTLPLTMRTWPNGTSVSTFAFQMFIATVRLLQCNWLNGLAVSTGEDSPVPTLFERRQFCFMRCYANRFAIHCFLHLLWLCKAEWRITCSRMQTWHGHGHGQPGKVTWHRRTQPARRVDWLL